MTSDDACDGDPKLAYLVLVHKNPEQIGRLIQAIHRPGNYYLVHVDRGAPASVHVYARELASKYANVFIMRSRRCRWGGYSMVRIQLDAIRQLLEIGEDWDFFFNLSGQDFPLRRQEEISAALAGHRGKNFITCFDPLDRWGDLGRLRVRKVHLEIPFTGQVRCVPKLEIERRFLLGGARWYGGWQWMILSRDFCEYVSRPRETRRYRTFFRHTLVADESFFQTVIMNSEFRDSVVNDYKRQINWEKGPDHPRVYTLEDEAELLGSGAFFARKFDPAVDDEILRLLEERLGSGPAELRVDAVPAEVAETGAPSVSVLMPVWNGERFIARAIESILSQTFTDFEFLIFDDGSTDRSLEIARRYAERDSRILLFPRPHVGYTRWLNEGLARARGEFVARMDADDIAVPYRLEQQVDYLRQVGDCVAVGSSVYLIDADGAPICEHRYDPDHETIDGGHIEGEFNMILHPASTFRRSALVALGGYREEYHTAEDYDLFLRLAEVGRLANLPDVLLHYRKHHDSVNVRRHVDQAHRGSGALAEARARRGMPPVTTEVEVDPPSMAANHRKWALAAAGAGHRRTALKHAVFSVRRAPLAVRSWYVVLRCVTPVRLVRALRGPLQPRATEHSRASRGGW